MKKIIFLLFISVSLTLTSCQSLLNGARKDVVNVPPNSPTMSQEVQAHPWEESEQIAINEVISYTITNRYDAQNNGIGGKLEIDNNGVKTVLNEEGIITEQRVTDKWFIYSSALGGGQAMVILDKFTGKIINTIPFSISTNDGKFIIACNQSGYSPGEVKIYSTEKQRMLYQLINEKGEFSVEQCNNQYDSHKMLQFVVSYPNYTELFIFDFTTGKIQDKSYRYSPNARKWSEDTLEILNKKTVLEKQSGFLQRLSQNKYTREGIGRCLQSGDDGCIPQYHMLKMSPRERYLELEQRGFETSNYEIYSLQDKKIVYSHNGYLQSSGWTPDNSQMFFISIPGMGAGSGETTGVFVSIPDRFPEFQQIIAYQDLPGCSQGNCEIQLVSFDDSELQLQVFSGAQKQAIWVDLKDMKFKS